MLDYDYSDFPDGLIYEFDTEYSGSVLLHISVIRPDQTEMLLLSTSLPYSDTKTQHHERIFTTDNNIKKNLEFQSANLDANKNTKSSEMLIFSDANGEVLNGRYLFNLSK